MIYALPRLMRPAIQALALVATLALGCTRAQHATQPVEPPRPSAVEPADDVERTILLQLPALAPGQPATIESAIVTAEAPYPAASGRTCRSLTVTRTYDVARSRLACIEDGEWFFVPQIFQTVDSSTSAP